jgi:hypothetical protein
MAGPDIKTISLPPEPLPGQETAAPQPDTKNLDALLDSLNGSAERFQTLWFSFLGLTLYLAVTALATTHRNLLLGEPQTLPILNIKVELLPFYVIAQLFYFVFHFYVLMMLVLLAHTAAPFEHELWQKLPNEDEQELYWARIENALFLQLLVGMKSERVGINARLLGAIAVFTIVVAPLATLILIQMMFLPYHSLAITWWHRGLVAADAILIFIMWRRFFADAGVKSPLLPFRSRPRFQEGFAWLAYACLFGVAFWLSGWEGRFAGEQWIGRPNIKDERGSFSLTRNGVAFGLFPDRLKLHGESIVGEKLLDEAAKESKSRNGDFVPTRRFTISNLEGADLSQADLRGVDLSGKDMRGADLFSCV